MSTRLIIVAMATALGCTACGFKGPLYLPQQNAAVVTHPAPTSKVTPGAAAKATAQTADKKQQPATPSAP